MLDFFTHLIIKYPLGFEDYAIFIYACISFIIPFLSYGWYKFCLETIKEEQPRRWITLVGRLLLNFILAFFLLNLFSTVFRIVYLIFGFGSSTTLEKIISLVIVVVVIVFLAIFPWRYLWRRE